MFKFFSAKKEEPISVKETEVKQPSVVNNISKSGELSDRMPDRKLVAIVTSAIAASRGESDCAFNVISINKIS
ncbi:MAG: hypothetical protein A2Y15_08105 [Clostridiales bacterium GWF2_36_10]|nr:MAG: hypothetical protein A2Y15_08105 [Clostridiales bacterium GWF2_36_10]HAN21009.1 hypothetical protein [Clostridiales bacterium]